MCRKGAHYSAQWCHYLRLCCDLQMSNDFKAACAMFSSSSGNIFRTGRKSARGRRRQTAPCSLCARALSEPNNQYLTCSVQIYCLPRCLIPKKNDNSPELRPLFRVLSNFSTPDYAQNILGIYQYHSDPRFQEDYLISLR